MADETIPGTSGAPIRIEDAAWAKLVALGGLNEDDLRLLGAHDDFARDVAPRAAEAFSDHLLRSPELRAILDRHTTGDRLPDAQRRYVASLFSGRYDDDTVRDRVAIGRGHDRIDLPVGAYLG